MSRKGWRVKKVVEGRKECAGGEGGPVRRAGSEGSESGIMEESWRYQLNTCWPQR